MSGWRILVLVAMAVAMVGCETASDADQSRGARIGGTAGSGTTTYFLNNDGTVSSQTIAGREAMAKSWWEGDGVEGAPSVVINLSAQTASFYKGGKLVGVSAVSTGREAGSTPTGTFRISQKSRHHRSNLYGDYVDASGQPVVRNVAVRSDPRPAGTTFAGAPMPYFMRVVNGVGMHEGFLPGFPDSHGCIRMPEEMAANFYANVQVGTPVRVVP